MISSSVQVRTLTSKIPKVQDLGEETSSKPPHENLLVLLPSGFKSVGRFTNHVTLWVFQDPRLYLRRHRDT